MNDKQILAWLKAKGNSAHTKYVNVNALIRELEAMLKAEPQKT